MKDVHSLEETPKPATFGRKPSQSNNRYGDIEPTNEFISSITNAIDFFSEKVEFKTPSKNKTTTHTSPSVTLSQEKRQPYRHVS